LGVNAYFISSKGQIPIIDATSISLVDLMASSSETPGDIIRLGFASLLAWLA
jgi:hypothetical protein